MRAFPLAASLVAILALVGCAEPRTPASSPPTILPLTKLRLYETGVGYFERSGAVEAGARSALPVPAGHIDDALKTLVVLSANGRANVNGVEFGSSVSRGMARAMAGLPLVDGEGPITYRDLLLSLRGAGVEVHAGRTTYTGRLIDVVGAPDGASDTGDANDAADAKKTSKPDDAKPAKHAPLTILILTDKSEIVRLEAQQIESIRPTDPAHAARLDAALDALSTRGAQSRRFLELIGESKGPVTLAYIAETPIWRTTYRLVLDPTAKSAVLQAWALLHNDTDEDWRDVKVELVNGRPDSFLFPLAAPRYGRRELVHPDEELSTVPQLMGRTVDAIWGDHVGDSFGAGGLGMSGVGEGGGGRGEGIGLGSFGSVGHGSGRGDAYGSSSLLGIGNLANIAQAAGTEAGALFVYSLATPLGLRRHASALVPYLQQRVESESIAWIDGKTTHARSAVRFVNATTQTLPPGTIAFFADGGFAGESALDRMKPGERRFLQFGADLDVELHTTPKGTTSQTKRVTFANDHVIEHFIRTTDATFGLENRSGRPRAIYVALHIDRNAKITGADDLDFDLQSSTPVAVFRLAQRQRVEKPVTIVEGLTRAMTLASLTSARLGEIAASPDLAAADKTIVVEAIAKLKELEESQRALKVAREELAAVDKELARLREDVKALGGERGAAGAAGVGAQQGPFVTRLLAAEDKHTAVKKRIDLLDEEVKVRSERLRVNLAKLTS